MNIHRAPVEETMESAGLNSEIRTEAGHGASLHDFRRVVRVRRKIILGTAGAILGLTLVVLFIVPPLYLASAVVMLNQQKNNVEDISAVLSDIPTDQVSMLNQVQILTSRGLAKRVVDKLNLLKDPEFNADLRSDWLSLALSFVKKLNPLVWLGIEVPVKTDITDQVIDVVLDRLDPNPSGLSTTIEIDFYSRDPRKAQRISNEFANAYVEDELIAKFTATQKATQWLTDKIEDLSRQVQAADSAVQEYKAEHGLAEIETRSDVTSATGTNTTATGTSVTAQQVGDISTQLVTAKADLAQKEATYTEVASLARAGRAADISEAVASPLIATLRGQETDILQQEGDLSSKYGARHPKMLDLESQKANVETKIADEVRRIVVTVASDVTVARARVNSLQDSLQRLENKYTEENRASVKLKALEANDASIQTIYQTFVAKLQETQGQQGIQTPDVRILSTAEVPIKPSFPNKLLVIGAAVPGSLLLGLMLAFMMERVNQGFRTASQIESLLGLPLLASIPEVKVGSKSESNAADWVLDKPVSSFTEAIRGLLLGLTRSTGDSRPKVILIASSVPDEGKTTLAVSLARTAAQGGLKTVLVEADLRTPRLAKTMGIKQPTNGIFGALAGQPILDSYLAKDSRSNAVALLCTKKPKHPSDVLSSTAMEHLIGDLKRKFDLVIIDSPPVLPVNDAKILGRLVDAIVFVVRWERTPLETAQSGMRALSDFESRIAGIALTRTDARRFLYYNYGCQDYRRYNQYYSEGA